MLVTRINADAQATIPAAILEWLGLSPGDEIAFDVVNREVVLMRPDGRNLDIEEHGPDDTVGDEELQAAIDAVPDDSGPTISIDEAFSRAYAIIEQHRQRRDAA